MTPRRGDWLRAYANTLVTALALIVLILGAQGIADKIERDTEDRLAYRIWVADACIPARPGERAVAVHEGARLSYTIYSNSDYGRAPIVISAAVMETPQ